jgi:hypothetical protein
MLGLATALLRSCLDYGFNLLVILQLQKCQPASARGQDKSVYHGCWIANVLNRNFDLFDSEIFMEVSGMT